MMRTFYNPPPGSRQAVMIENSKSNEPPHTHMVQLDALRALAVFTVMVTHFLFHSRIVEWLPWDELGVQLFFVLSGFLITGILLRCKSIVESTPQTSWLTLRQFYARRFLRISPLFYTTIAVLALMGIGPVRETIFWHLTYLSNVYFVVIGKGHGSVTHFWTLAVEEQFYLVWPFIILFTPRKYLLGVIVLTICSAPLFRAVTGLIGTSYMVKKVLPFGCIDTLGFGALLAILQTHRHGYDRAYRLLVQLGLWLGAPLFVIFLLLYANRLLPYGLDTVFQRTVMGLFYVWLIDRAGRGFGGVVGWFLQLPPLIFIGKISYGIYVLHNFVPELTKRFFAFAHIPYPWDSPAIQFALLASLSVLIATISWYTLERPLNNLKRYYPYRVPA